MARSGPVTCSLGATVSRSSLPTRGSALACSPSLRPRATSLLTDSQRCSERAVFRGAATWRCRHKPLPPRSISQRGTGGQWPGPQPHLAVWPVARGRASGGAEGGPRRRWAAPWQRAGGLGRRAGACRRRRRLTPLPADPDAVYAPRRLPPPSPSPPPASTPAASHVTAVPVARCARPSPFETLSLVCPPASCYRRPWVCASGSSALDLFFLSPASPPPIFFFWRCAFYRCSWRSCAALAALSFSGAALRRCSCWRCCCRGGSRGGLPVFSPPRGAVRPAWTGAELVHHFPFSGSSDVTRRTTATAPRASDAYVAPAAPLNRAVFGTYSGLGRWEGRPGAPPA